MLIYRLFTKIGFIILYPFLYLIFRKNQFKQRITIKSHVLENTIWVHASSLGEVNAVKPLIVKMIEEYPRYTFLMTSMTKTGLDAAKKMSSKLIIYPFPFDTRKIMKRAFKIFNPKAIIIVETEIWPNMIDIASKIHIPIIMVNARISDKSYPKYKLTRFFWKSIFQKITLVNAQSEIDKERFQYLGSPVVENANNLKFSITLPKYEQSELRKAWKYLFNDFIIVFGSSRPGEEKLIYDIAKKLKFTIPRLKVIIVPRHLYRISEIENIFPRDEYCLFSENYPDRMFTIVDEMGILPQVYALSNISIIGGSFFNFGGHNPIEAAIYEKAVIIGPYHYSCLDLVTKFKAKEGIIVSNCDNLQQDILKLYNNIETRIKYGKNAIEVINENQNSLELHLENINKILSK